MYCSLSLKDKYAWQCKDIGHILFAFVSTCFVSKNLNTPNWSSMADNNAITRGSWGVLGSPFSICDFNLSSPVKVVHHVTGSIDAFCTVTCFSMLSKIWESILWVQPIHSSSLQVYKTKVHQIFTDKVIRHNPPLPGLTIHALPVLNHNPTDHNTKPMEYWCIATVAWTSCYCMKSSLCGKLRNGEFLFNHTLDE